jgi:hypothetical protein
LDVAIQTFQGGDDDNSNITISKDAYKMWTESMIKEEARCRRYKRLRAQLACAKVVACIMNRIHRADKLQEAEYRKEEQARATKQIDFWRRKVAKAGNILRQYADTIAQSGDNFIEYVDNHPAI